MCSDAYVSDFDSDDDEIVWPRHDNDKGYDIHSVSTVDLQPSHLGCPRRRVYEFGEFEETHGWVQCRSRSQRNRLYFHNMHSGCDTWYRPISRYINIPCISLEKRTYADDLMTTDLELMSVSDDEKERNLPTTARDHDGSSMKTQISTLARWYRVPQMDSTSDMEDYLSESSDTLAGEHHDKMDMNRNNDNDSKTKYSQFCIENFLETEMLVSEGEVNIEYCPKIKDDNDNASTTSSSSFSTVPRRTVYTTPRLKKIGFEEQIIKWQGAHSTKDQEGPRKIICEMYGVRTISYDPPEPDEIRPQTGVKTTKLSDSDSDNELSPSLGPNVIKNTSLFHWHDLIKDLRQPSLSDMTTSSSSSRSSKSSSSNSSRSTSSNVSTCSTCSTCCTLCE